VAGRVRAGEQFAGRLGAGQAIEIMTGAPLPEGADSVLQLEKTRRAGADRVELLARLEPGTNVAPRASELRAGDCVLRPGDRIDPATLAVLAAQGRAWVAVGRRPRLALLVTGDELVDVTMRPGPAQIRNSNGPAVGAAARQAGASVRVLGVVRDEAGLLADAVARGLADSDVLVVSGGVSAGAFDLVEAALARHDVRVLFERVAVKPGAPLVFGRRGDVLVFGLPGNPVSAQVTFELFVRPALLRLQGARSPQRAMSQAELLTPARNGSGRRSYLPAVAGFREGQLVARPLRSQGSGDVVAHARANALVVLGAERTQAAAGERVPVLLLEAFLRSEVTLG
jgi:molybdopterin molybdotransferase